MRKFLLIGMLLAATAVPDDAAADQWTVSQVSTGPSGGNSGDWTNLLDMTGGGSRILFATTEKLTPDDTDTTMDLYQRSGSGLTLMSPDFTSGAGNISEDGSTLVFQTPDRLVPEDTDNGADLYKRVDNTTTLLSIGPNGEHGPCQFSDFTYCNTFRAMSEDGQHVYFASNAHLAPGDDEPTPCQQDDGGGGIATYACQDVYENWNGVTRLVSGGPTDPRGPIDYDVVYPDYLATSGSYVEQTFVSRDGRAFFMTTDPLLPQDTDAIADVYEWSNGTLSLVTAAAAGGAALRGISDDGTHVFYYNGRKIWDHTAAGDAALTPDLHFGDYVGNSGDGSHLYFYTDTAVVPADTDGLNDIYDESTGTFKLMTRGDTPPSPAFAEEFVSAASDGSKAFLITSEPLVPYDDDHNHFSIYRVDSATGDKRIVSTGPADLSGSGTSPTWIGASNEGTRVLFETSSGLVANDGNGINDIYEWNGDTSVTTLTPDWTAGISYGAHTFTNERMINDAGTRVAFITDRRLRATDTDSAQDVYETSLTTPEPPGDPGFYAKPAGATPVRVSLVPTFQPCAASNRQHGAPLSFGSCTPPVTQSSYATVDTGGQGQSIGFLRMDVIPGNPNQFGDQADVHLGFVLRNVSRRANGLDYDGKAHLTMTLRLTDRTVAGTVQDVPFSFDAVCTVSDFDPVGSVCDASTSADAVLPGSTPEGARSIWQLGPIQVLDGGADGNPATNTSDNRMFAVQGVFVP